MTHEQIESYFLRDIANLSAASIITVGRETFEALSHGRAVLTSSPPQLRFDIGNKPIYVIPVNPGELPNWMPPEPPIVDAAPLFAVIEAARKVVAAWDDAMNDPGNFCDELKLAAFCEADDVAPLRAALLAFSPTASPARR